MNTHQLMHFQFHLLYSQRGFDYLHQITTSWSAHVGGKGVLAQKVRALVLNSNARRAMCTVPNGTAVLNERLKGSELHTTLKSRNAKPTFPTGLGQLQNIPSTVQMWWQRCTLREAWGVLMSSPHPPLPASTSRRTRPRAWLETPETDSQHLQKCTSCPQCFFLTLTVHPSSSPSHFSPSYCSSSPPLPFSPSLPLVGWFWLSVE